MSPAMVLVAGMLLAGGGPARAAVDGVLAGQIQGLKRFVETGSAKGA